VRYQNAEGQYVRLPRLLEKHVWRGRSRVATLITDLCDMEVLPRVLVQALGTGNFFGSKLSMRVQAWCHWYICRIDYGRPNVWGPMYSVYLWANRYVHGETKEDQAWSLERREFDPEEFAKFRADPKRQALVDRILADEEPSV
jgi:hypothetical protein